MITKKLIPILALSLLILGWAPTREIVKLKRTDDLYDAATGVYYNKSIPLKMSFPKDKWYIYPDIDTAPVDLFGDIKKLEKKARGGEFAMVGQHISRAIHVLLLIEQGISDMSPFEYFKLIREINKEEFSGIVEIFARERMIGEQDCAEFDFQGKFNGLDMTMRWLVFLRNNYACQLRIGVPTVLYQGRKVEIENLLDSVSFP